MQNLDVGIKLTEKSVTNVLVCLRRTLRIDSGGAFQFECRVSFEESIHSILRVRCVARRNNVHALKYFFSGKTLATMSKNLAKLYEVLFFLCCHHAVAFMEITLLGLLVCFLGFVEHLDNS